MPRSPRSTEATHFSTTTEGTTLSRADFQQAMPWLSARLRVVSHPTSPLGKRTAAPASMLNKLG